MFGNCLASTNYLGLKLILNEDDRISFLLFFPESRNIYPGHDLMKDQPDGALEFQSEFLNIFTLATTSIIIGKNAVIVLLFNLDVSEVLYNLTRLIVTSQSNNTRKVIGVQSNKKYIYL